MPDANDEGAQEDYGEYGGEVPEGEEEAGGEN